MKRKLGEGDPPRSQPAIKAEASAASGVPKVADMPVERAQRLGISCAWCGFRVEAGAPRMRLFQSEGVQVGGKWIAHFHRDCGRAVLRLCAEQHLSDTCREIAAPGAAAVAVAAAFSEQATVREIRASASEAKQKPDAPELMRQARDLSARGFTQNMIAARLRVPYAFVAAALAQGKRGKREPIRQAVRS